jgi:hypothetical protein
MLNANHIKTPAEIDAAIPRDTSRPGLPGVLEVLGRRVKRVLGKNGFDPMRQHVELGRAATILERTGFDWRDLRTPAAVIAKAEEVCRATEAKAKADAMADLEAMVTAVAEESAAVPMPLAKVEATLAPAAVPSKAKPKRLGKGACKALRKQKAEARSEAARAAKPIHLSPSVPAHEPVVKFTPGLVIQKDGVPHVVCTGQRGQCFKLTPVDKALVAKSITSIMHALGVRRFSEIDEDNLPSISFCPTCAKHILLGGFQIPAPDSPHVRGVLLGIKNRLAVGRALRQVRVRWRNGRHDVRHLPCVRVDLANSILLLIPTDA